MTQSNISGYTGKPKTGSKKSQPKPYKNSFDKKSGENLGVKSQEKIEFKDTKNNIKSITPRTGESKLQWRKETKKSQRSFSKNKERMRLERKSLDEQESTSTYSSKKPYSKPSTGFSKAKGGWNQEKPLKKITRNWEIPGETRVTSHQENDHKFSQNKAQKITSPDIKKPKPKFVVPTWEKEFKKVDKKGLVDSTMI